MNDSKIKTWSMVNGEDINEDFSEWFLSELFVYIIENGANEEMTYCDCDNYCGSWYIAKVEIKWGMVTVTLKAYLGGDERVIV